MPNERLGKIRFGESVARHIESGLLEPCERLSDGTDSVCFIFDDDEEIAFYADEHGMIDIIATERSLIFQGKEFIGLPIDQVAEILGREPDEISEPIELEEGGIQTVAEFDGLGLHLWLRENLFVSASLTDDMDDGDL